MLNLTNWIILPRIFGSSKDNNSTLTECGINKNTATCKQDHQMSEDSIREMAYFKWLAATGGNPVSEQETRKFWLEAESTMPESC
jgi:hypothetical protein